MTPGQYMSNAEGGSRVTLPPGAGALHDRFHWNEMNFKDQMVELERGASELLLIGDLVKKLERGAALRVKAGFDPTAPDLHLGHTVLLNKMRQFQLFGHEVTFLIGDFTGMIGDPTGRNTTRPPLTPEEIQANARTYEAQVFKILDRERTRIDFNSRWLSALTAAEVVKLAAHYTVARMLERDDFSKRYKSGQPISNELMWRYFELLSFRPLAEIAQLKREAADGRNPRDIKFELARELVSRFHDGPTAERAHRAFIARVSEKAVPDDLPVQALHVDAAGLKLGSLMKAAGLAASSSEANRKIEEGAVRIDGARVTDRALTLHAGAEHVIQVGSRRFAKVRLDLKS